MKETLITMEKDTYIGHIQSQIPSEIFTETEEVSSHYSDYMQLEVIDTLLLFIKILL